MTVKITYFVHATTMDNEQGRATGQRPGTLSPLGMQQARGLAKQVEDAAFQVVFCSDLRRAVHSATLAFGDDHRIIQDERLREIDYGDFTGRKKTWDTRDFIDTPYPGGESYRDVEKRMADFLAYLDAHYRGKHIAMVAHQAPQLALEVLLKGKTWERAMEEDWRRTDDWQPGWRYVVES